MRALQDRATGRRIALSSEVRQMCETRERIDEEYFHRADEVAKRFEALRHALREREGALVRALDQIRKAKREAISLDINTASTALELLHEQSSMVARLMDQELDPSAFLDRIPKPEARALILTLTLTLIGSRSPRREPTSRFTLAHLTLYLANLGSMYIYTLDPTHPMKRGPTNPQPHFLTPGCPPTHTG